MIFCAVPGDPTKSAEIRDKAIRNQLFAIETTVNQQMRETSIQMLKDKKHMPPVLRMMEKLTKYTFETPNDGGTGAQYRGALRWTLRILSGRRCPL